MLCCFFTLNLVCLWSVVPKLSCDRTLLLIQSYAYILYGGESFFIPLHRHAACDFSPKQFWPQEQHNRCRAGIAQFPIPNNPYGFLWTLSTMFRVPTHNRDPNPRLLHSESAASTARPRAPRVLEEGGGFVWSKKGEVVWI